ncbi:MAG: DedA family protein [Burkholderiaceae bacterium]|nr:DedA family protein [Burkholderiaceae bacterium]MDZ4146431.1 DedA family protein [Burkholderiales bacterium]
MEVLSFLVDFILHVDKHLAVFVQNYGSWVYALLFIIVFTETGLVVMPFLPGDSLLFVVGALSGAGLLDFPLACGVLLAAAILGDQCNYSIGRYFGPKVFKWENSRLFNRRAFDQAHAFYERYGGITIVLARFMPFIRTFAPFVAGVAAMGRAKFTAYNVLGALIWVLGIGTAGYLFGNVPWVQANLEKIIWAMILVPGVMVLWGAWRAR